jgi:hypothetical protein
MTVISPPGYVVWSTDRLDLADAFQRRWYIRQCMLHGKPEDIARLGLAEVARLRGELNLPAHV